MGVRMKKRTGIVKGLLVEGKTVNISLIDDKLNEEFNMLIPIDEAKNLTIGTVIEVEWKIK